MKRTKAELDAICAEYPNVKKSMEQSAYNDHHNGRGTWERDQQDTHAQIHHSDIKHEQTFPREERTIWSRKT